VEKALEEYEIHGMLDLDMNMTRCGRTILLAVLLLAVVVVVVVVVRRPTGDHCERIKFGKSRKCGEGGLCLHGEGNGTAPGAGTGITSTWGGEAVRADDGTYHV